GASARIRMLFKESFLLCQRTTRVSHSQKVGRQNLMAMTKQDMRMEGAIAESVTRTRWSLTKEALTSREALLRRTPPVATGLLLLCKLLQFILELGALSSDLKLAVEI